jgi:hypothetical protein
LFVLVCAASYGGLFSHAYPGDTATYAKYGRALVNHGEIPYRDFYDEYPPGSVPFFAAPVLISDAHYVLVFKLLMTACGVGFVACATWILRRLGLGYARLVPVVLAPALLGPLFFNRYDPVPALFGSLALVALLRGRDRAAGSLLGIATAVKLYPAVALPLAFRRIRELRGAAAGFAAALAVLVLPFAALSPGGVGFSAWTQAKRHLQLESLGSSLLLVLSKLGIHHEHWVAGAPSTNDLGGALAETVGTISSLGAFALVLLVARAYWRGPDTDARLVTAWAAAVSAFVVFGKVLSPQFLVWLVPLVPLAAGRRGRLAAGAFLVALALALPEYLYAEEGLLVQNWTVWLLLVRNAVLVAMFWFLYTELRDGGGLVRQ